MQLRSKRLGFLVLLALAGCDDPSREGAAESDLASTPDASRVRVMHAPVRLTDLSPTEGPVTGGTDVLLVGKFPAGRLSVFFGEHEALDVRRVDHHAIRAITPPGVEGAVDVVVRRDPTGEAVLPKAFRYVAAEEPAACCSISASPGFGADEVDVTASVTLTFAEPVDGEQVAETIVLEDLGADAEVAVEVEVVDERTIVVRPTHSLAFFADYALTVGDAVTQSGGTCETDGFVFSTRAPAPAARPLRNGPANAVAVLGDVALTASATYRGLQVHDVSDPSAPVLIDEISTVEAPVGLTVEGDRAYVPAGTGGVLIFDVSDPAAPARIGRAGTPGSAREVAAFTREGRRLLAVADGTGGLRILDATEPEGATTLAWLHPNGLPTTNVTGLDLQGDLLAVAQVEHGFALVDVSTPSAPVVLSNTLSAAREETFQAPRPVMDVRLGGDTVYLAMTSYGVQAFDVSDPAAPVHLDHEIGPGGFCSQDCPDEIVDLKVVDDELFVASAMTGAARMALDGDDLFTRATHVVTGRAYAVTVAGAHLYVGTERGLAVFPRDASTGQPPLFEQAEGWGSIGDVAAAGDRLFASSSSRGLEIYSLADPLTPAPTGLVPTPGVERDYGLLNLRVHGDLLFVGDGRAGLSIFDATEEMPTLLGELPESDGVGAMWLEGSRGYTCSGNWAFWVIDFSDPGAPERTPLSIPVSIGGCNDLAVAGDTLYVAGGYGIGVYDVSNADAPDLLRVVSLPADDVIVSLVARGDRLYATTFVQDFEGTNGTAQRLAVFDVSDPLQPQVIHRTGDLGGVTDLLVQGDKLFVGGRSQGVHVFGLGDPDQPALEGTIALPGVVRNLTLGGTSADRRLYVAQLGGGVGAISLGSLP